MLILEKLFGEGEFEFFGFAFLNGEKGDVLELGSFDIIGFAGFEGIDGKGRRALFHLHFHQSFGFGK